MTLERGRCFADSSHFPDFPSLELHNLTSGRKTRPIQTLVDDGQRVGQSDPMGTNRPWPYRLENAILVDNNSWTKIQLEKSIIGEDSLENPRIGERRPRLWSPRSGPPEKQASQCAGDPPSD